MKKKSFIFNVEWREVLMDYSPEVRLEVYDAIIEYVASGTLTELKPVSKMAFSFIKRDIDRANERYIDICEKRSEAGKKAMENRWGNKETNITNVTSDNKNINCHQMVTNITDNDYDNDYVSKKEPSTNVDVKKEKIAAAKAATLTRRDSFRDSLIPYVEQYGKGMIRSFYDYWSELNKSQTQMRYEKQPTWELAKRLATWHKREKFDGESSNQMGAYKATSTDKAASRQSLEDLANAILAQP